MGQVQSLIVKTKKRKILEKLVQKIKKGTDEHQEDITKKYVTQALEAHKIVRKHNANGSGSCGDSKIHALVYLAGKLALLNNIQDTMTVVAIIMEMYLCEKNFDRIVVSSLFEPEFHRDVALWRGQFDTRSDSFELYQYLVHHANLAKLELPYKNNTYRMVDFPIATSVSANPCLGSIEAWRPDVFKFLLDHGGEVPLHDSCNPPENIVRQLELELPGMSHVYQESRYIDRRDMAMRYYERIGRNPIMVDKNPYVALAKYTNKPADEVTPQRKRLDDCLKLLSNVRSQNVPGVPIPSLKHMARLVIRKALRENFMLPHGIQHLPVPQSLHSYLKLDRLD